MQLPKFEHVRPGSLEEASKLMREYGRSAQLVAGGTDLIPRMKYGLAAPEVVVSLKGISARAPAATKEGDLELDALATLADIIRSPQVENRIPVLREAALAVGSKQIRHMATVGGNLCLETRCLYYNQSHRFQFIDPCFKRQGDQCYLIRKGKKCWAVFSADTVPALISAKASIEIVSVSEKRRIPLEDLYTGDPLNPFHLSAGEIISTVRIPAPTRNRGLAFVKCSTRGGLEFAALSVAVSLEAGENRSHCENARITFGAVASGPIRANKTEAALAGQPLSSDLFQEAAQMAANEVRPLFHHGYSSKYLRYMLEIQTRRTLATAADRIGR
jgi:4-hydroxybenzoyl-CoA reductase beta subunit